MAKQHSFRMVITPPSKPIDTLALDLEIATLGLPGYSGIAVQSRDVDAQGNPVKDQNGRPVNVPRFLLVHSDTLTNTQKNSVRSIVTNHVPPPPDTDADEAERTYKRDPEWQGYIKLEAASRGITEQAMIDLLKANL